MKKPCAVCGKPCEGARCALHPRDRHAGRGGRQARGYDREYDINRRAMAQWAARVWAGGGGVGCCLCGRPIAGPGDLTAEHVIALAAGGTSDASNLRPAHRSCNFARRKPV